MSNCNRYYIVVQFTQSLVNALSCTDQPGPPVNLSPIVSAITESSAVVQWERPEETGGSGISISSYTVTVSGGQIMPESVSDDGRQNSPFSHTISGLDYETDYTVRVVAINSCGDTSQPATIDVFIDAESQSIAVAL